MYERLDKLREEVKRCEKRRDEVNERLKAAQAKLKEAEAKGHSLAFCLGWIILEGDVS